MATRRVTALAVGVVLATLALGVGWLRSTLRDRDARLSDARGRLERRADLVRAAVDESLEELRAREDERPFYLYNHYYSPPEVLAISDPVARSPLALPPTDVRLVGHFQVDPEGEVQTPYDDPDAAAPSALGAEIATLVESPALAPVREGAAGDGPSLLQPGAPPAETPTTPARRLRPSPSRREAPPASERRGAEAPVDGGPEAAVGAGAPPPDAADDAITEAPLTVGLNAWSNLQAREIAAAQRGDVEANNRLLERGRQVPRISRRDVGPAPSPRAEPEPSPAARAQRLREADRPAPRGPADTSLGNMVQREAEVDYTTMVYRDDDGVLLLHRRVTHAGVSVVQGLLFDRERLVRAWIPALVARHAEQGAPLAVVTEGASCAVRRPASRILTGVDLCVGPSALDDTTESLEEELRYQLGGLAGLCFLVLLAASAIVAAARRAEALSKQKSAFVSAVSHELRTPLTTLRMHAEMLEGELVTDARRPKVHRELVRESVRLARLVENVLSLSKLEEGRRTLRLDEGCLSAHVRGVVEEQRAFVEERGFTLAFEGPARLPASFDAQAVEQIVVNLIDNALKYGGGEERAIEVVLEDMDGAPRITVLDRGPGIPERERAQVFERFHRVERAEHAHAPGTGIGLSLVAELAEAHGGGASAHPRDGGGLALRVTLG